MSLELISKKKLISFSQDIHNKIQIMPIIALTNDAYDRVMNRLTSGEEFVKTYRNICPHNKREDCNCPFYKNILVNGEIVRIIEGETIKVHNLKKLMENSIVISSE